MVGRCLLTTIDGYFKFIFIKVMQFFLDILLFTDTMVNIWTMHYSTFKTPTSSHPN